jgi:hypothetical protein
MLPLKSSHEFLQGILISTNYHTWKNTGFSSPEKVLNLQGLLPKRRNSEIFVMMIDGKAGKFKKLGGGESNKTNVEL